MAVENLSAARLREIICYEPATGAFTARITRVGRSPKIGEPIGRLNCDGYLRTVIDGREYRLQRLAFLYMTGEWPQNIVDHRDGDRLNNRWSNLRDATCSVNQQNRHRPSRQNRSGLLGVRQRKDGWAAVISVGGRNARKQWLGLFKTPEAARSAYLEAKRRLHPGSTL
jgi:hypothetical protein